MAFVSPPYPEFGQRTQLAGSEDILRQDILELVTWPFVPSLSASAGSDAFFVFERRYLAYRSKTDGQAAWMARMNYQGGLNWVDDENWQYELQATEGTVILDLYTVPWLTPGMAFGVFDIQYAFLLPS